MRRSIVLGMFAFFAFVSTAIAQPAWSRGEQKLAITFDEAMKRAEASLKAEGYVNLQRQANFIAGYKGTNTAIIMCNDAPDGMQWINIVVSSISSDGSIPGAERVKLQGDMNQSGGSNSNGSPPTLPASAQSINWTDNPNALGLRGKNNQRFTFTCPAADYLAHSLYGTDNYTDDSSICTAGVHAGVISAAGGNVTIEIRDGRDAYTASTRNGVSSSGWGAWPGSFVVVK